MPVNVGQLVTAGKQVALYLLRRIIRRRDDQHELLPGLPVVAGPAGPIPGHHLQRARPRQSRVRPFPSGPSDRAAPPLSWMRGQGLPDGEGLPAPFDEVPRVQRHNLGSRGMGFPGILQMDNPFYEGRDVSALIDWALANTHCSPRTFSPIRLIRTAMSTRPACRPSPCWAAPTVAPSR